MYACVRQSSSSMETIAIQTDDVSRFFTQIYCSFVFFNSKLFEINSALNANIAQYTRVVEGRIQFNNNNYGRNKLIKFTKRLQSIRAMS